MAVLAGVSAGDDSSFTDVRNQSFLGHWAAYSDDNSSAYVYTVDAGGGTATVSGMGIKLNPNDSGASQMRLACTDSSGNILGITSAVDPDSLTEDNYEEIAVQTPFQVSHNDTVILWVSTNGSLQHMSYNTAYTEVCDDSGTVTTPPDPIDPTPTGTCASNRGPAIRLYGTLDAGGTPTPVLMNHYMRMMRG